MEAEANWDDNGDSGVSDHSVEDTGIPVLGRRKWPIVDRGERHPFEQFHDTSGFGEADSSFFATCEGMTYDNKDKMKDTINHWHIKQNREIKNTHSDTTRLRYKCVSARCRWALVARATGFGNTWAITKNVAKHTCHASASRYEGIVPKYNKLWRGRELAIARAFDSWEGSYGLIVPLLEAIKRSNPGTQYKIVSKPTTKPGYRFFMRAAWAWGPCIAAVGHLRPVISIDACFLSGRYKGKLLIVTGYDAENQLIPLAFGLVENEDFENWGWFMKWVREFVIGRNRYMCVVSDRHKGINKVFIQDDLGWCEEKGECAHRYCSQHKKRRRLQEGLDTIGRRNPAWLAYLDTCGKYNENDEEELPKPWKVYQAMDDGSRWEIMTSNGSESLNHVFKTSRGLPVAAIIEETFYKCVSWFEQRSETAVQLQAAGQLFSTRVHKKLDKHIEKTKKMSTLAFGHNEFMVTSHGEKINFDMENGRWVHTSSDCRYKVIMKNDHEVECQCQKPQMGGIPCVHVMAVCRLR
ncbi:uncharacterized protein LOC144564560 [Carex rostrata]